MGYRYTFGKLVAIGTPWAQPSDQGRSVSVARWLVVTGSLVTGPYICTYVHLYSWKKCVHLEDFRIGWCFWKIWYLRQQKRHFCLFKMRKKVRNNAKSNLCPLLFFFLCCLACMPPNLKHSLFYHDLAQDLPVLSLRLEYVYCRNNTSLTRHPPLALWCHFSNVWLNQHMHMTPKLIHLLRSISIFDKLVITTTWLSIQKWIHTFN